MHDYIASIECICLLSLGNSNTIVDICIVSVGAIINEIEVVAEF